MGWEDDLSLALGTPVYPGLSAQNVEAWAWSWKPKTLTCTEPCSLHSLLEGSGSAWPMSYLASEVMFLFLQGLPHVGEHLKPRSAKSHTPHALGLHCWELLPKEEKGHVHKEAISV